MRPKQQNPSIVLCWISVAVVTVSLVVTSDRLWRGSAWSAVTFSDCIARRVNTIGCATNAATMTITPFWTCGIEKWLTRACSAIVFSRTPQGIVPGVGTTGSWTWHSTGTLLVVVEHLPQSPGVACCEAVRFMIGCVGHYTSHLVFPMSRPHRFDTDWGWWFWFCYS